MTKLLTLNGLLLNRDGFRLAEHVCAELNTADLTLRINSTLHNLDDVRIYGTRVESLGGAWTLLF